MYLADEFIRRAQTFLKVKIRPGTIKEVKETREQHEKDSKIDRQRLYERFLNELQYIQRHLDRLQAESMYIEAQRQLAENQFPDERDQLEHRYVQLQRELHSLQRREPELRARLADLQRQRREELATLRMQEEQTPTDN